MNRIVFAAALMGAVFATQAASAQAADGVQRISAARAAAIHECSVLAQRYPEPTFASLEFEVYRACMAGYGQVE